MRILYLHADKEIGCGSQGSYLLQSSEELIEGKYVVNHNQCQKASL